MKKVISIMMCVMLICFDVALADENHNITNKLNGIWLSPNNDVAVLKNIEESNKAKIQEVIDSYLIAPEYAREKIGISADDDVMEQQVKEMYAINADEILKVYYLNNNKYAKQYADNQNLSYLVSEDYNWFVKGDEQYRRYDADGAIHNYDDSQQTTYGSYVINQETVSFLKDEESILKILTDANITNVNDIKVIALHQKCTCLYINSSSGEFVISVYKSTKREKNDDGNFTVRDWGDELELYKIYKAKDFMQIVSETENVMDSTKQIFEMEAMSLQENGLLYGNEKGLDLLKPLTRIEAATMLLRALGESTTNKTTTQTFADVPATHWGYGAAENAYSLGLIKGVGDDMFAPDDIVTGPQFATMILRAGKHTDFNWEEALDILISEGVISTEDASTMDFFTRGDMAKIIYEAIQKRLF